MEPGTVCYTGCLAPRRTYKCTLLKYAYSNIFEQLIVKLIAHGEPGCTLNFNRYDPGHVATLPVSRRSGILVITISRSGAMRVIDSCPSLACAVRRPMTRCRRPTATAECRLSGVVLSECPVLRQLEPSYAAEMASQVPPEFEQLKKLDGYLTSYEGEISRR